jgi:pimeloyl-ACP methyl ester carboxylesterase
MIEPKESFVEVNGCRCRVWEAGIGEPLGFIAGFRGVPRWTPFLSRLAQTRRVIVPSLPGFPGSEPGHLELDETADWITMILDLLEASGLAGCDLAAASIGAMPVADAAALSPNSVGRLVLVGPLGLYSEAMPVRTHS